MRVICIHTGDWDYVTGKPVESPLKLMATYTVVDEAVEPEGLYYVLEECAPDDAFSAKLLIPLSDLDETELVNEEWADKIMEPINN